MNLLNSRLVSLIRKEFLQIIRDPRTLALVLGIPIMQLLLLGYAATNDVRNVPLAVFDQDRGPAARRLLDAYRAADYFRLSYEANSEEDLQQLIDRGDARAGLIIPPDYSQRVESGQPVQVAFVLDGSDPTIASSLFPPPARSARNTYHHCRPGYARWPRVVRRRRWRCAPRCGTTPI